MPSREVLSQLSRSEPDVTGLGPVQDTNDYVPQGLLEMHHKLAAKPNGSVHRTPAPSDTGRLQASQASHVICARGVCIDIVRHRIELEAPERDRQVRLLLRSRRR
ncbi:hypothetical protein EDB81DRAFT_789680 [Dactylonectria macrodidyma]|uniref:Uncharacterized protein n=1 Tax=Dactylonectria macrodidyma TaxID=307937 RepID=A0A9P9F4G2_9HYPO|nr:hypothetical protein EDB81DRAFT_789680 [Dactylonectria macrodidyma]